MSDFASLIGGNGDTVPFFSADPNGPYAYFWNTDSGVSVDLGAKGDAFFSTGSTGDVTVFGAQGSDSIFAGVGDDALSGGRGKDQINAGDGNNTVAGGAGKDSLDAGDGTDRMDGGDGRDTIHGGDGDDTLFGGDGKDQLYGEAGNDTIFGNAGSDELYGGLGNDSLLGGSGRDSLFGDEGDDTLWGGDGADAFFFDSNFGNDVIKDFGGGDEIWLTNDINGSGISAPSDLITNGLISGGVDPVTNQPFTTISINGDTIRIENLSQSDFESNINSFVKIAP